MTQLQPANGEPIEFAAKDGVSLASTRFTTPGKLRGRILVAGATGVPQAFYARFAAHAAGAGFETTTFDYRGIARSKRGSLAGFNASFVDWARLDLAGAIDAIADDGVPLFLVAHSFGGHALGITPNHGRLAGAWICAAGAGWAGWNPAAERIRLWALWNVVFPPLVRLKGYMPMSIFGMGEDLPLGVYRQWRHWCSFPHYFLDDPAAAELKVACATVRVPILATTALDDAWAPPRSRDAFLLGAYPNSNIVRVEVDPRAHGGEIGHVGYFRRSASGLWDRALTWFADAAKPNS
jgi:predicted alpha/beta hydrolase